MNTTKKAVVEYKFRLYAQDIVDAILASAPKEIRDTFREHTYECSKPKSQRWSGQHYPDSPPTTSIDITIVDEKYGSREEKGIEVTFKGEAEVVKQLTAYGNDPLIKLIDKTLSKSEATKVETLS